MIRSLSEVIDHYREKGDLSREEEALITRYLFERQSERGTTIPSMVARTHELMTASRHLHKAGGRLDLVTTQGVLETVIGIREGGYSKNYTHRTIQTFKAFLFWCIDEGLNDQVEERKIRKIRSPGMDWHTKKSEDLLTRDEVDQVLEACQSSRDRVIIAVLYDGGFRPGELPTMTWKDMIKDDYGYRMEFITPKTGHERFIRFTMAVPYINAWRLDYPGQVLPDSPVFLQTRGHSRDYEPLALGGIQSLFKRIRKRTGIAKLTPAIFRPTRMTHENEEGMDQTYLMMKNFGHLKTQMLAVYVKPNKAHIDQVALEKAGIKKKEKEEKLGTLAPIICPECQTMAPSGSQWCPACGYGLTDDARSFIQNMERAMKNPANLRAWAEYLEKKGSEE